MPRSHKQTLPSLSSLPPIEIDPEPTQEVLTSFAGLALVAETLRALGLPQSVERNIHLKERQRGFSEAQMVQSLLMMLAAGGESVADIERLRADPGLPELLGHQLPSSETALKFLKSFHDESKISEAKQRLKPGQLAFLVEETGSLEGLAKVNQQLIAALCSQMAHLKQVVPRTATVDQDATIIESRNRNALYTYEGMPGYQPMVARWAELGLALCDEFRDGNVPAMMQPLLACKRAFAALPKCVTQYFYRADSASYQHELLAWLSDDNREDGPQGPIGFCISAKMSPELNRTVLAVAESDWRPYRAPGSPVDEQRDVAEVPFVPSLAAETKHSRPLRYVAVRIRAKQGELFSDGNSVKHFVVVSNLWEMDAAKLLQWHRQKAGSIEALHDETKNELGGGVMPSRYFGANAAWFRLALLTHNVLVAMKRLALGPELLDARPKRLRFEILWQAARVVHHARRLLLRISTKLRLAIDRLVQGTATLRALPAPS